jgi:hypothetical protein
MTIYRLYAQNGDRAGFWVQHRSWGNLCARVQSIGGKDFGALPGQSPLHEGAQIAIECFDVRSGRRAASEVLTSDLLGRNFVMIAKPSWYAHVFN